MNNYALMQNDKVTNVIVAERLEDVVFFFPETAVIEVTEATGQPAIGLGFDSESGRFIPGCYSAGWLFNKDTWAWEPPLAYPQDGKFYEWDDESGSWIQIDLSTTAEDLEVVPEPSPEEVTAPEAVADTE